MENVLPFIAEQLAVSTPDMVAIATAFPLYIAGLAGELAQDRAHNDGRQNATLEDVLKVLPSSVASALLDRLGLETELGLGTIAKEVTKKAASQGIKQTVKTGAKEVAKATAVESGTEFTQEVLEGLGSSVGTQKGVDVPQLLEAGLSGCCRRSGRRSTQTG